jgi:hypothetical protein
MLQPANSVFDGVDEIVFSNTYNLFEKELTVKIHSFTFKFIFETTDPAPGQKDIQILPDGSNAAVIRFSSKVRSSLGGGSNEKLQLVRFNDSRTLHFTAFAHAYGTANERLNVTLTFYARK